MSYFWPTLKSFEWEWKIVRHRSNTQLRTATADDAEKSHIMSVRDFLMKDTFSLATKDFTFRDFKDGLKKDHRDNMHEITEQRRPLPIYVIFLHRVLI